MRKTLLSVSLMAMVCVQGIYAQSSKPTATIVLPEELNGKSGSSYVYGVSANGRYIHGKNAEGSLFLYDTQTGSTTWHQSPDGYCASYGVSDNGIMLASITEGALSGVYRENGEWEELPLPAEYVNVTGNAISTDGTLIAGWADISASTFAPCVFEYINGAYEITLLPYDTNSIYTGGHSTWVIAGGGISADGNIISGAVCDCRGYQILPCTWTRSESGWSYSVVGLNALFNTDKENPGKYPDYEEWVISTPGTPDYEAELAEWWDAWYDYEEKEMAYEKYASISSNYQYLSADGKHLAVRVTELDTTLANLAIAERNTSVIIDLTTGEGTYIDGFFDYYGAAVPTMTEDGGLLFVHRNSHNNYCANTFVVDGNDVSQRASIVTWLKDNYSLDLGQYFTYSFTTQDVATGADIVCTDSICPGDLKTSTDGKILAGNSLNPQSRNTVYYISFSEKPVAPTTGIRSLRQDSDASFKAYFADGKLKIRGFVDNVTVCDMNGQCVYDNRALSGEQISTESWAKGMYVVSVLTADGIKTSKIIKK